MVTFGKSRIEALSDGVFAIAMTLLVLKLEVPEGMEQHSNEEMLRQFAGFEAPQFLSYVVTFLIAGGFWFLHHLTFHFIKNVYGVSGVGESAVPDVRIPAAIFGGIDGAFVHAPGVAIFLFRKPTGDFAAAEPSLAVCGAAEGGDWWRRGRRRSGLVYGWG